MSYTKLDTVPDVADGLATLLAQNNIAEDGLAAQLIAAAGAVTLDTGQTVWCSCVVHDKPETPQIDLCAVALECVNGAPRSKPNGQLVGVTAWRGVWPAALAEMGVDTIRKACLMIALGEPQPQVPVPVPAQGGPTEQDVFPMPASDAAAASIRAAISAADQLAAPPADVL